MSYNFNGWCHYFLIKRFLCNAMRKSVRGKEEERESVTHTHMNLWQFVPSWKRYTMVAFFCTTFLYALHQLRPLHVLCKPLEPYPLWKIQDVKNLDKLIGHFLIGQKKCVHTKNRKRIHLNGFLDFSFVSENYVSCVKHYPRSLLCECVAHNLIVLEQS